MAPPTAKRPRTPTKGAPEPTTKKKKRTKQKKGGGSNNVSFTAPPASKHPPPPNVTTANAPKQSASAISSVASKPSDSTETAPPDDTLIMAQMIATFSHFEQSRFSAFTRASLSTEAVQEWISTVVRHRCNIRSTTASSTMLKEDPDMSLVVSMAAKSYAQRLLTAAVGSGSDTKSSSRHADGAAITYDKVLAAAERMPPLFYAHGGAAATVSPLSSHATGTEWEQKRLAALEAQEAYEEEHGVPMEEDGEMVEGKDEGK